MDNLDTQFEELIVRLNKAEARVVELESDVNKLKATNVFANNVIDDLKPYSVNQRQMVNSYLKYTNQDKRQ